MKGKTDGNGLSRLVDVWIALGIRTSLQRILDGLISQQTPPVVQLVVSVIKIEISQNFA
jgi:hypothetical protein